MYWERFSEKRDVLLSMYDCCDIMIGGKSVIFIASEEE